MQTILITGGSSGIGLAVARQLAYRPCQLVLVARSPARLASAARGLELTKHSDTLVTTVSVSVTDPQRLALELEVFLPQLDVAIHCAGLGLAKTLASTSEHEFRKIIETNLFGTVNISRLVAASMQKRGKGRLLLVSSAAGLLGIYGYTAYSASKFGVEGFAQSLRNELVGTGVSLGVVYPPDVNTPMLEAENLTKPDITRVISGGVLMTPEAVASCIVKHISRSSFRIFPGFRNWLNCFFITHFPQISFTVIDRIVKRLK